LTLVADIQFDVIDSIFIGDCSQRAVGLAFEIGELIRNGKTSSVGLCRPEQQAMAVAFAYPEPEKGGREKKVNTSETKGFSRQRLGQACQVADPNTLGRPHKRFDSGDAHSGIGARARRRRGCIAKDSKARSFARFC
jgi:hypothetical protein